jgi:hypothetical protein
MHSFLLISSLISLSFGCSPPLPMTGKRVDRAVVATSDPTKFVLRQLIGGDNSGIASVPVCGTKEVVSTEFALLLKQNGNWTARCLTLDDAQLTRVGPLVTLRELVFNISFVDVKSVTPPPPSVGVVPAGVTVLVNNGAIAAGRLLVAFGNVLRSVDATTGTDGIDIELSGFNASCDALSFSKEVGVFRFAPSPTAPVDCKRLYDSCESGIPPRFFRVDFAQGKSVGVSNLPIDIRSGTFVVGYNSGPNLQNCSATNNNVIVQEAEVVNTVNVDPLLESCNVNGMTTAKTDRSTSTNPITDRSEAAQVTVTVMLPAFILSMISTLW